MRHQGALYLHAVELVRSSDTLSLPDGFARLLRRADVLTRMAVTVVFRCLARLEQHGGALDFSRCMVIAGLGMGTLETNVAFVDSLYEQEGAAGSPTLFSHSVHNTVAGYVSRLFNVRGPSFTVTDFALPFLTALSEARCCIAGGMADMAIVVGSEMESSFMKAVHTRLSAPGAKDEIPWEYGATAWIVAARDAIASPAALITGPDLNVCACRPEELLLRLTEDYAGKGAVGAGVPFGYAVSLSETVSEVLEGARSQASWEVRADFGKARLVVQRI